MEKTWFLGSVLQVLCMHACMHGRTLGREVLTPLAGFARVFGVQGGGGRGVMTIGF